MGYFVFVLLILVLCLAIIMYGKYSYDYGYYQGLHDAVDKAETSVNQDIRDATEMIKKESYISNDPVFWPDNMNETNHKVK